MVDLIKPPAFVFLSMLLLSQGARAQDPQAVESPAVESRSPEFEGAAAAMRARLEHKTRELVELRQRITDEKLALSGPLRELERQLSAARLDFQQASVEQGESTDSLASLTEEIQRREAENRFLSTNLSEYIRNFQSRLHVAEAQRYADELTTVNLAMQSSSLSDAELFSAQAAMVMTSIERLHEVAGGTRFEGSAVDESGLLNKGTFAIVGPAALFLEENTGAVGTAEQEVNSLAPTTFRFTRPEQVESATRVATTGDGLFPLDPTGGNAHKIEATEESFIEHVQKGGPVMIPIFFMASAALLVALWKWIGMLFVRRPSERRVKALLKAVENRDPEAARREAVALRGPVGSMLRAGVKHMGDGRELIEEVMYEKVLEARLKLQSFLPFIAVCAASAPLLGLLGTVTGIINTFKLITVFGSGDVKTLSGGISEALITTKFGLIVAIPSLLLHAYLSRQARAIVSRMETAAVGFVNQVAKTPMARTPDRLPPSGAGDGGGGPPDPDLVREQVQVILSEMLGPLGRAKKSTVEASSEAGVG